MLAQSEPVMNRRVEKILVVIFLLLISGGIANKRLINVPPTLVQLLAVFMALIVMRRQMLRYLQYAFSNLSLVIVVSIAVLSVFWSLAPLVSLDQVLWLILITLFGIYIAASFTLEEQLELVLWMTVLAAITSFIVAVLAPEIGIHPAPQHEGQWRGVFLQKNILSRYMALGAVLALYFGRSLGWLRWTVFAFLTFILILSGGAAGVLALVILIFAVPFYQIIRFRHMIAMGMFLISIPFLVLGGWWLSDNFDGILFILNRDETLTGRTDLWAAGFEVIDSQPLFGHGFRATFVEGSEILNLIEWRSAQFAHNHWIDMALDLGIVTVLIFAFGFFRSIWKSLLYAHDAPTPSGLFPFTFLTFLLIVTMSTQSLLGMFDVLWIIYVSITVSLSNLRSSEATVSLANTQWQNRNPQQLYQLNR